MEAIRLETVVPDDGVLKVSAPDLHAGDAVEVIVLRQKPSPKANRYPLKGTLPCDYKNPFEPAVPVDDWEANR